MLAQPPALWLVLLAFVCMLGPLVFFHELGHYLVARWFRCPRRGVLDRLRPRDRRLDRSPGHALEDRLAAAWRLREVRRRHEPGERPLPIHSPTCDRGSFQLRPVWQRFLIVLAGPIANFLLAILIFAAFFTFVGTLRTNVVDTVKPNSAARAAGILPGDRILSVAGIDTPTFPDIASVVAVRPNQTVAVELERAGQVRRQRITLQSDVIDDGTGAEDEARPAGHLSVERHRRACLDFPGGADGGRPHRASHASDCRRSRPADRRRGFVGPAGRTDQDRPVCRSQRTTGRFCRSSACSRCSQLIWDSSTSCQSRCWMAATCSSIRLKPFGGGRSANGRWNGRRAAGSRPFSLCCFLSRLTISARSACGTGFNA